ncbi:MAG: apolipoprotein N-acyltransferase [Thalassovita sp.]
MMAAFLCGLGVALGQAPFHLWPIALLGLTGCFGLVYQSQRLRDGFWLGWAGGVGFFALALNWIVEPFLVDVARHGWMAPFALVLLAAGLALFWGLAGGLCVRLGKRGLAWIAAMAAFELVRSYIFTGFPWALVGQMWSPYAPAQWAAFVGVHGLNLASFAISVGLYFAVARRNLKAGSAALLFLAALWSGGIYLQGLPVAGTVSDKMVRLVQPNAPQHQKWDPAHSAKFFQRQIEATKAAPRPDLIIWPETSVPIYFEADHPAVAAISKAADGVPVVFGVQRFQDRRVFNSAVVLDEAGHVDQIYDKHHLVPFGEYVPLGDFLARFGIYGLASQNGAGFSAGPGPELLDIKGLGKALVLICYEAVFPQDIQKAPARPDYLLQITNDAWFGQATGPYQHFEQARLRAIEQGLPMIRVANTGVSAVIDAKGHTVKSLPLGRSGWIDAMIPAPDAPTVYSRFGDLISGLAILLMFLTVIVSGAIKGHRIAD